MITLYSTLHFTKCQGNLSLVQFSRLKGSSYQYNSIRTKIRGKLTLPWD